MGEKLSSSAFVSLSKCGHKFHTDCLVNTVEHQSDPHYLQCPNCMTIHGIKQATCLQMQRCHGSGLQSFKDFFLFVTRLLMVSRMRVIPTLVNPIMPGASLDWQFFRILLKVMWC